MKTQIKEEILVKLNEKTDSNYAEVFPQHFIGDKTLFAQSEKTTVLQFTDKLSAVYPRRGFVIVNDLPLRTFELWEFGDN